MPDDVFINVFLDHGTTSALISEGLFNFVNFTGSVEGGRAVERAAARAPSPALGLNSAARTPVM